MNRCRRCGAMFPPIVKERCEYRERRWTGHRVYTIWCKQPAAPHAQEWIGELGALFCAKHAAERRYAK